MASIRAERQRFLQSPFTVCLSKEAAKTRRPTKELRRVVMCRSCGSFRVLGNSRGDHLTRDASRFFCDSECQGIALAIVVTKDESRLARKAAVRADCRARAKVKVQAKNRLANLKCCLMCGTPHTKKAWCSKECAKLSAKLRQRSKCKRRNPSG